MFQAWLVKGPERGVWTPQLILSLITYPYTGACETMCHCDMCLLPTNPPQLVYIHYHRHKWGGLHENTFLVHGQNSHQPVWEQDKAEPHFVLKQKQSKKTFFLTALKTPTYQKFHFRGQSWMFSPCSPPGNQMRRINPRYLMLILSGIRTVQGKAERRTQLKSKQVNHCRGHLPKKLRKVESTLCDAVARKPTHW